MRRCVIVSLCTCPQSDSCLVTLTAIVVVFVACNLVKMGASLYEMLTLERLAVCRSDTNSFGLPLWEVILNMLGIFLLIFS
jgi:hypothetical protein